jgi:hypothetical protein
LLAIRLEDGTWLIDDEELRRAGTPKQIRAYVECDHGARVAEGGTNDPQNLWFRRIPDHAEKTRTIDIPEIAKGKRYGKKHEEFVRRLLAKQEGEPLPKPTRSRKGHAKIRSRGFPSKEERREMKAKFEKARS